MSAVTKLARPKEGSTLFAAFWVLATPSLVDLFDRVVVFQDGRITADGPPSGLLKENRDLQRLVA